MWNERRNDVPKLDVYRAQTAIRVFETLGFRQSGKGSKVVLMAFTDKERSIEDFMIQYSDVAVLYNSISDILQKIHLPVAFFDYLYETINRSC